MLRIFRKVILFFELRSFGVCAWWARKLGIQTDKIRLVFIYASFFTFGSSIVLYFIMAWILEYKHYFKFKRTKPKSSIWEL